MLEDILKGQEKSRLVLITDTSQNSGRHLLLNWIEQALDRCEKLILVCFDRSPGFFTSWLPPNLHHKLICIDGELEEDKDGEPIYSLAPALVAVTRSKVTSCVVIDSLSMPILMRPAPTTCSHLHKMASSEHVSQVVAVVHRDVTDEHACILLEHGASTVIDLLPSDLGSSHVCHVRHCRSTGKVFKTKECYEFDDSFHISKIKPLKDVQTIQQTPVSSTQEPDPTAGLDLSFKLELTESEKEARSQVVLPYLKDSSTVESTSRIIYEADDGDDFDEEDPDDDLNI